MQSQLKMDKDTLDDVRQQRVTDVMQEVHAEFTSADVLFLTESFFNVKIRDYLIICSQCLSVCKWNVEVP